MAVTFPDAVSSTVTTANEDPATNDHSHTVTSGTTLLLCFVASTADESASGITWGSDSQAMTEVSKVDATSNALADAGGSIWALVNPKVETSTFEITSGSGAWFNWHIKGGLNVHGTATASVAAAISELSNDENKSETSTNVHASGGTSGNKLLFFGVGIGDDMVPASNDASFNELAEIDSGGGKGNNNDGSVYICEGDAPSAITVTWNKSDENAGSLYEIVAANDVNVSASTETLTVATPQASVALDVDVQASTASLTLAEQQASIANDVNVTTNVEALTLAEQQASIAVDVDVSASTSALTLQEQQASIAVDVDVATSLAELTIATHQATVAEGEVEETPAKSKGGRKRKRYIVEIDNQFIEVASVADAQAVLEQAREVAEDAATQLTEPVKDIPRVSVKLISGKETKSKVLRRDVVKTEQAVEWIYRKAQQRIDRDKEISQLLQAKIREEDEEEEALIALLM